jgi:hypothetical protein
MKKAGLIVSAVMAFCINDYVMAQNSATPDIADLSSWSAERLKDGGEVPGFYSTPPGIDVLKNAITNPDGTRTIKKGQQTPEANELNKKICESIGAKDVTNDEDITIGSGTLFVGVCVSTTIGKHLSTKVVPVPGMGTGRIFIPIPQPIDTPQTSPEVPTEAGL